MKILNMDHSDLLEKNVKQNEFKYTQESFELSEEYFEDYLPISEPQYDWIAGMIPSKEKDFESAVALFEAFPYLTNLEVSSHSFWNTLSHTVLFDYVKKRWPYTPNANNKPTFEQHIINHWFYLSGLRTNALAHLWWCVKMTVKPEWGETHKYDLTKILFANYSFRVTFWGSSNFFRNQEATEGVLRWIKDNFGLFMEAADRRGKFICIHLHKLGAVKQLCSLGWKFFYDELNRIKPLIVEAPKRPDKHKTEEEKMEEDF